MAINLLLDARKLGDGGIGVYIENLIDGLLELEGERVESLRLTLLVGAERQTADSPLKRWAGPVELVYEPSKKYSLSEYFSLAKRNRELLQRMDIFHSPHYTLPFFLGIKSVVTVHDIIHITHPDTPLHRPVANMLIQSALKRAAHIITVSESSHREVRERLVGVDTPISIIPNALRPGFSPRTEAENRDFIESQELPPHFCLFVGSDRPHKGFKELLYGWAKLRETWAEPPVIVAVGGRFSERTKKLVLKLGLERFVYFYGEASSEQLSRLYAAAEAVIIPSRQEGFGLVALEAMASGAPLICSPVQSLKEVCGGCAWFMQGLGSKEIADCVTSVFGNDLMRRKKVAAGLERALEFSRRGVALATYEVYRDVLRRGQALPRTDLGEGVKIEKSVSTKQGQSR